MTSPSPWAHDPERDARLRRRFQAAAVVCVVVGLVSAIVCGIAEPRAAPPGVDEPSVQTSKVYEQEMEHMGGKGLVVGIQIGDTLRALVHPPALPYTCAVAGLLAAGICVLIAHALGLPPSEREKSR